MKRQLSIVALALATAAGFVVAACANDSNNNASSSSGGTSGTTPKADAAPTSTGTTDAGPRAPQKRTGCLDRPPGAGGTQPAPNGKLPCELIPPGLAL